MELAGTLMKPIADLINYTFKNPAQQHWFCHTCQSDIKMYFYFKNKERSQNLNINKSTKYLNIHIYTYI